MILFKLPAQGFIQDFELDGSRMIVVCETHACLLGGSGDMLLPPAKFLIYIPLRLLLTQSGIKFPNIFDDTYLTLESNM